MNSPEHRDELHFTSIVDLLISVAKQNDELEKEAHNKLHGEQDVDGYLEIVLRRAKLIVELPDTIRMYKEKGVNVPDEVEQFAESYAAHARQFIEENNTFGMSILLTQKGSTQDEPNELEKLVHQIQAQTGSDS